MEEPTEMVAPTRVESQEIMLSIGKGADERTLTALVKSPPPDHLRPDPALVVCLSSERNTTLGESPYNLVAGAFLSAGHRALAIDLPYHGERATASRSGLPGIAAALQAGEDVFGRLDAEVICLVDACLARGWARAGRIAIAGTSRGGFAAMHAFAADGRIAACAAFAPVVHWPVLAEFKHLTGNPLVRRSSIRELVPRLVGRPLFYAIGYHDDRVGTERSCELFARLRDAELAQGIAESKVDFLVTMDPGHTLGDQWYGAGTSFLMKHV
jgi:Prolyl oligopeptidase family